MSNVNWFWVIDRILNGDAIWVILTWFLGNYGLAVGALFGVTLSKNKWVPVLLALSFSILGAVAAHYICESLVAFYKVPLGPHL
jgi:hypothetical protein